ncbi:MAG: hypothetical protein CM15mP123_09200 [Gammaproteobacteria bacterium]|nr:MAG: hypothetical protein CM15mP123_09200 [Gammaproteobacteria bacterium]
MPDNLKKAISRKTKAILPVHLYGQLAEMKQINEIAKDNDLLILEDCAQAQGASENNIFREIGEMLELSVFILEKI